MSLDLFDRLRSSALHHFYLQSRVNNISIIIKSLFEIFIISLNILTFFDIIIYNLLINKFKNFI